MLSNKPLRGFVRSLLREASARREGEHYVTARGSKARAAEVLALISAGVLSGNATRCGPNGETAGWIRRQLLTVDAHAGQHRQIVGIKGLAINLCESPIARLATVAAAGHRPFLEPRHVEAAERVRRLFERAKLRGKLTTRYDEMHATDRGRAAGGDLSDMAVDARRALSAIYQVLPLECAEAVIDICGFLKGLQQVEAERNWPKRSAKLILRMGLDRLATEYGFATEAVGPPASHHRNWMDAEARPSRFE